MPSSLLLTTLKLSDTNVYEPQIRARLGTTARFCEVVVLKLRTLRGRHVDDHANGDPQIVFDKVVGQRPRSISFSFSSLFFFFIFQFLFLLSSLLRSIQVLDGLCA